MHCILHTETPKIYRVHFNLMHLNQYFISSKWTRWRILWSWFIYWYDLWSVLDGIKMFKSLLCWKHAYHTTILPVLSSRIQMKSQILNLLKRNNNMHVESAKVKMQDMSHSWITDQSLIIIMVFELLRGALFLGLSACRSVHLWKFFW